MDRPTSLLEQIALRLSPAGSGSESRYAMATLLSSEFAVTTYHAIVSGWASRPQAQSTSDFQGKEEVVLHFDLWPEPFERLARVVKVDFKANLALLKLQSELPRELVPSINFATNFGAVQADRWESVLLPASPDLRLNLNGRITGNDGRQIMLVTENEVPAGFDGLSGAPVVVGDVLFGVVSAYRYGKPQGLLLQAISAEVIDRIYREFTASQKTPGSDSAVDLNALFERLSKASLQALEHAEGIQRKIDRGKVHSEQLVAGLYQKQDGELRALMRTAKLDDNGLFEILDKQARKKLPRLPDYRPIELTAMPTISAHVEEALINAQKAADDDKSETINSWHLLYGILAVDDCDLTRTLKEKGLVKEKVRRGLSRERGGPRGTVRPNIAGFSSDDPRKGTDHFGIGKEVKVLCSVLAAKSVEPPLSLGLFGDWGSGKSFFMGQMEKEFEHLKKQARADKNSPYCKNIVQLWFNAWHYMDGDLWASLASEIFEGLAEELVKDKELDVGKTDPETARARLIAATASKKDVLVEAERRKNFAETELKASEEHLTRLKEADVELAGNLSWQAMRAAYRFVVNQPEVRAQIEEAGAALKLSPAEQVATETKAELLELKGLGDRAKALYIAIKKDRSYGVWFFLLVCLALVLVVTPLLLRYKEQFAGLTGVIGTFLIGLGGLLAVVKPYLSGVNDAFRIIEKARADNAALIKQKRDERETVLKQRQNEIKAELQDATQRVQEARDGLGQLERQLEELRADRQMANFIKQRHESSDYVNQLGTIARARNDFEKLSDLLEKVKKQAEAEAAATKAAQAEGGPDVAATNGTKAEENLLLPRIDRIILYIDDLDRCPENKVVDVLQAVHLLLAFPLFVVVVGVDPRWLLHSLKQHSKVFQGATPEAGNGGIDEDQRHWQSTPLNYLEKIFQIPFTLRPMAYDGFGEFIEDLAKPTDDARSKTGVDKGAGTAGQTEPTADAKTEPSQPGFESTGNTPAPGDETQNTGTSGVARDALKQSAEQPAQDAAQQAAAGATASANTDEHKETKPEADLSPEHLRIEDWERTYMKLLFWLIPSPRAAKRFVNIYRLLRASVPDEKRAAFVGDAKQGEHRVALLLLAIEMGYPTEAADMVRELLKQDKFCLWWQFIDEFETQHTVETKPDQEDNGQGKSGEAEAANFRQLFKNLGEVRELIPSDQSCADFIYWAPQVARYSFQSGRVLLAQRDAENTEDN